MSSNATLCPGEYVQLIPAHPENAFPLSGLIINNNCHIICVVNFYIKRSGVSCLISMLAIVQYSPARGYKMRTWSHLKINDFIG